MISLSHPDLLIAEGAYCRCYRHPDDPTACIKIPTNNPKARKRQRADLAYYRKLHQRKIPLDHLADYLGPCKTDQGQGHCFQFITDEGEKASDPLAIYTKKKLLPASTMVSLLQQLLTYLKENQVMVSDLHERNILIQCRRGNEFKAILVDGIGDRVAIPILNLLPRLVSNKIQRRWDRFIHHLNHDYPWLECDVLSSERLEKK